jgi:hypothetical protein
MSICEHHRFATISSDACRASTIVRVSTTRLGSAYINSKSCFMNTSNTPDERFDYAFTDAQEPNNPYLIMKTLKTVLQTPVLLLILYLGSVNLYETVRAFQATPRMGFGWELYASVAEGILEVALLVVLYRWLGRPPTTEPYDRHA